MPDPLLSFLPVVDETADDVRARFNADANAGVDPADAAYIDTTEGGFYWDLTQPAVLECARLWQALGVEIVAAMFPGTAWGDWLDLHGETVNLPRDDEVQATGEVLFAGVVGTLIPAHTRVATVQADPSSETEPVEFDTDQTITLAVVPGPVGLVATPSGVGGTIPAGSYYYRVTAVVAAGETIASNEEMVTLTGASSSVGLAWTAVAGATAYKIYRGVALGAEVLLASPAGTGTAYTDNGSAVPGTAKVPTNTVAVTAVSPGFGGNVGVGTITEVLSPVSEGPTVTNPQPTSGGADVESDDRYRLRILAEYGKAAGAGNVDDYVKWALEVPQIGFATVTPLWAGPGTVHVVITDRSNNPNSVSIVQLLQARLDPVPQQGRGQAPIGALVTVATPTPLPVDANAAGLVFHAGYSLDGAGGTIPLRQTIIDSVSGYLNALPPGEDAVLNAVVRQIMGVRGVLDVGAVTLNGTAANVAVAALEVAAAGTVTLA